MNRRWKPANGRGKTGKRTEAVGYVCCGAGSNRLCRGLAVRRSPPTGRGCPGAVGAQKWTVFRFDPVHSGSIRLDPTTFVTLRVGRKAEFGLMNLVGHARCASVQVRVAAVSPHNPASITVQSNVRGETRYYETNPNVGRGIKYPTSCKHDTYADYSRELWRVLAAKRTQMFEWNCEAHPVAIMPAPDSVISHYGTLLRLGRWGLKSRSLGRTLGFVNRPSGRMPMSWEAVARQQKAFAVTAGLLQVGALKCGAGDAGGAFQPEAKHEMP